MTFDYSNYTVIVTGGTRGIGRAISESFLKAGATVIATYCGNDKAANEFKAEWPDAKLELEKFDVSDYDQVTSFFSRFDETHERLDVLVNNAGIRRDNVVGMLPIEDWHSVLETNLTGSFSMSKMALMRMMQNRFGRIINITSPSGQLGFAGQANYAAAKAGQVALAKSLAKEAAKRKITVNCVSPGFIDTELIADLDDDLRKQYRSQVPMKRFGSTEEVANGIMFLASAEASYITGTTLEITGGL